MDNNIIKIGQKVLDLSNIEGIVIESPYAPSLIRVSFNGKGGNWRDLKPDQLTVVDNNIIDNEVSALYNCLNHHNLNGYKIHLYHQQDKRKVKPLYFLTDAKGTSLTGHWDFLELNSFIRGYGKAYSNLIEQRNELLEAFKEVVRISDRKHIAWDKAKEAIKKATI